MFLLFGGWMRFNETMIRLKSILNGFMLIALYKALLYMFGAILLISSNKPMIIYWLKNYILLIIH